MPLDEMDISINADEIELVGKDPWPRTLLQISVSWMEGTAIMVLIGEVDLSTASLLQDHFDEIVLGAGRADLVVDLGLVTSLGSTGMSFLVTAHRQLQAQGSRLVVFAPPYRIRRLFDICELNSIHVVMPDNSDERPPCAQGGLRSISPRTGSGMAPEYRLWASPAYERRGPVQSHHPRKARQRLDEYFPGESGPHRC
jgi:anti-anti-sigma factor